MLARLLARSAALSPAARLWAALKKPRGRFVRGRQAAARGDALLFLPWREGPKYKGTATCLGGATHSRPDSVLSSGNLFFF